MNDFLYSLFLLPTFIQSWQLYSSKCFKLNVEKHANLSQSNLSKSSLKTQSEYAKGVQSS